MIIASDKYINILETVPGGWVIDVPFTPNTQEFKIKAVAYHSKVIGGVHDGERYDGVVSQEEPIGYGEEYRFQVGSWVNPLYENTRYEIVLTYYIYDFNNVQVGDEKVIGFEAKTVDRNPEPSGSPKIYSIITNRLPKKMSVVITIDTTTITKQFFLEATVADIKGKVLTIDSNRMTYLSSFVINDRQLEDYFFEIKENELVYGQVDLNIKCYIEHQTPDTRLERVPFMPLFFFSNVQPQSPFVLYASEWNLFNKTLLSNFSYYLPYTPPTYKEVKQGDILTAETLSFPIDCLYDAYGYTIGGQYFKKPNISVITFFPISDYSMTAFDFIKKLELLISDVIMKNGILSR